VWLDLSYLDDGKFNARVRALHAGSLATKERHFNDSDWFAIALSHIAGKCLTWKKLTGKEAGSVC
jgi:hypothetical protein